MDTQKILFTALSTEELSAIMEKSVRNVIGDCDIKTPGTDHLLNARQAAKLINYRRPTLYGLVRQNKIPYSKTFLPDNQEIFDDLYFSGLGFEDELFIETKRKKKPVLAKKTQAWRHK